MKENKAMTRNMKNINFVSKDVQRILSSHNISEKYNDQEAFYIKKLFLKISQYHRKTTVLESLF